VMFPDLEGCHVVLNPPLVSCGRCQ
jgi:hypothetical protein